MAIITYGDIITNMKGSVGGVTYSRNKYGAYKKNKPLMPVGSTMLQQAIRNIFGTLSQVWQTLTAAQRLGWKVFADSVVLSPGMNRLDALPEYIRCNAARMQAGMTRVDAPPTTFVNATAPDPTSTIATITAASGLSLAYASGNAALAEVGGAYLVYLGPCRELTQNNKDRFRLVGKIAGAVVPPTSPYVVAAAALPYLPILNKNMFVRVQAVRADARISSEIVIQDQVG